MSPNITIQHHQAVLASNVTEHHQATLGMSLSIVTSGAALPMSPYNITKLP